MSRYPVVGRAAGGYDQSLLQKAPQVTRADRQEGYSVDILEQGRPHGPNAPRRQPIAQGYEQHRPQQPSNGYDRSAPPSFEKADYYSSSSHTHSDQRDIFAITPYKPKKPWYRTKRGLAILFVVLLVLAGATVGIVFGVNAMRKAKAAERQRGPQSGNGSDQAPATSADRGGAANTVVLPTLPSLSLITLGRGPQATSTISQQNLALTLNPAPAASALQTGIAQAGGVTLANVGPTPTPVPRPIRTNA